MLKNINKHIYILCFTLYTGMDINSIENILWNISNIGKEKMTQKIQIPQLDF